MGAVLFSAMKNEAPFILEWVAYHRVIGFDRIIIVSNDSDDGTSEILDALDRAGFVEHIHQKVPPGQSAQGNAARLSETGNLIAPGDWVCWLDADEFLYVHAGNGQVGDLIAALGDFKALLVPWRVFGDNGHAVFPGRFISGDFVMAGDPKVGRLRRIKTFFQLGEDFPYLSGKAVHRPKVAAGRTDLHKRVAAPNGKPINPGERAHQGWLNGRDDASSCFLPEAEMSYEIAQINHYSVRTPEYFALKARRGRGFTAATGPVRHNDQFYREMNANQVSDRRILRHEQQTGAEIDRLLALPDIRQASRRAAIRGGVALAGGAPSDQKVSEFDVTLPPAERALLEDAYGKAKVILEYGSGGATFLAATSGAEAVFSVESDPVRAAQVAEALDSRHPGSPVEVIYERIGITGPWAFPVNRSAIRLFPRYAMGVWEEGDFREPDVILIGGRFRAACFAAALLQIRQPTRVLFDNYVDRAEYHWVESLSGKPEIHGRMAVFDLVPRDIPRRGMSRILETFLNPA